MYHLTKNHNGFLLQFEKSINVASPVYSSSVNTSHCGYTVNACTKSTLH